MRFVLSLAWCYFVLVFCSPLSIAITSLGEERPNLSAFRKYVCSICACLVLPVSFSFWCLGKAAACVCGTRLCFYLFSTPINCLFYGMLTAFLDNEIEEFRTLKPLFLSSCSAPG